MPELYSLSDWYKIPVRSILAWYRKLVANKFDGSKRRQYPGRPTVPSEVEALVVKMARENAGWGYDRIVGALANLGHDLSDQTVGNILRRHGIAPAPKRSRTTSWKDFISAHKEVLAGTDFFTVGGPPTLRVMRRLPRTGALVRLHGRIIPNLDAGVNPVLVVTLEAARRCASLSARHYNPGYQERSRRAARSSSGILFR